MRVDFGAELKRFLMEVNLRVAKGRRVIALEMPLKVREIKAISYVFVVHPCLLIIPKNFQMSGEIKVDKRIAWVFLNCAL